MKEVKSGTVLELGKKIKAARKKAGLTQAQLAKKMWIGNYYNSAIRKRQTRTKIEDNGKDFFSFGC